MAHGRFVSATSRMSRRGFVAAAGMTAAADDARRNACGVLRVGREAFRGRRACTGDIDYADWDAVLAAAKGQTVSWYGYGGDEARNTWINTVLAPALKDKYDITLDLVGMDINDILTQLSGEMQAGVTEGSIDFIWINGENFYSCKENGYLWGPFTSYLPNFNDYIDAKAPRWPTISALPPRASSAPTARPDADVVQQRHRRCPRRPPSKSSRRSAKPIPVR